MLDSKPPHVLSTSQSKSSLTSGSSSIRSPIGFSASRMMNRTSAGTTSTNGGTSTPGTPFSPVTPAMPRVDMPRPPDPQLDPAGYLRSLGAVRERSKVVTEKAYRNQLHHFDVDMDKFDDVVTFVSNIIKVSRWEKAGCSAHARVAPGDRERETDSGPISETTTLPLPASQATAATSILASAAAIGSPTSYRPFPRMLIAQSAASA